MADKRLIDANSAKLAASDYKIFRCQLGGLMDVAEFIEDQPTVDAVEVVRCRDCAKHGLFTCPICYIENKTLQFINLSPDFFCGEGERKDGEQ